MARQSSVAAGVEDRYQATWNELDVGLSSGRLTLRNPGVIRLTGYATTEGAGFYLRDRQVILEGHIWVRPRVSVDEEDTTIEGDEVVFRVDAVLVPSLRSARTRCSNVRYGWPNDAPVYGPVDQKVELKLTRDEVQFFDAPGGKPLWSLREANVSVNVVEERDGFSRVFERRNVAIDAWVPSSQIRTPPPEPVSNRIGCNDCRADTPKLGLPDESSAYPERVRFPKEAPIGVGKAPGGPAVGVLEPGVIVRVRKRQDGWIGFGRIRGIAPPTDQLFWVSQDAVESAEP